MLLVKFYIAREMTHGYDQFRVLYSLYDKFEKGNRSWIETKALMEEEELTYINTASLTGDIVYLQGKHFIDGKRFSMGYSYPTHVKILTSGIDIIRLVFKNYPIFLNSKDEKSLKEQYQHVTAIGDPYGQRTQLYAYIKERVDVFEDFLDATDTMSGIPRDIRQLKKITETNGVIEIIVSDIIQSLYNLNIVFKNKFGFKIIKDNSMILDSLRKTGNDRDWFTSLLAKLATLIDDIYYDEIKGQLRGTKETKSIKLLKEFFDKENVNCDSALGQLSSIHALRSNMLPTHKGEEKAVPLLEKIGVSYPISDWLSAGIKVLKEFLSAICRIVICLK
jgi:hypothetical protein